MTRTQIIILAALADGVLIIFALAGLLVALEVFAPQETLSPSPAPTPVPTVAESFPTPSPMPTPPPEESGPPAVSCQEVREITWWFGEVLSCTVRGDHLSVMANYSPIVVDRYGQTSQGLSLQRKLDSLAIRESALRAVYTYLAAFPQIRSLDLTVFYWRAPALTLPYLERQRAEEAARAMGGLGIAELADRYGPKDESIFNRFIHSSQESCYERGGEAALEALGVQWEKALIVGPEACLTLEERALLLGQ